MKPTPRHQEDQRATRPDPTESHIDPAERMATADQTDASNAVAVVGYSVDVIPPVRRCLLPEVTRDITGVVKQASGDVLPAPVDPRCIGIRIQSPDQTGSGHDSVTSAVGTILGGFERARTGWLFPREVLQSD
jgi:hypothetical protein